MCCSDLETLFINWKPFYSPREICSFILVSVYIPPQAHVSSALQKLADLITDTEQNHPDSVLIILGDFYKANLSLKLPKYRQHITCPIKDSNILDHCYTMIKDAYIVHIYRILNQDGAADGILHGVIRSCFYVFVSLSYL